ncbi:MAG: ribosomal protein S18-alanine N-acetyltransferase [Rhodocyclaceae bacterium]
MTDTPVARAVCPVTREGVVIAPMQADDLDWVSEAEAFIYPFPWRPKDFTASLDGGHLCWMLRYKGARAGYAILMLGVDEANLLNISVLPDLQGRGLGSALMYHVCEAARVAGKTQMFLEVRESNDAAQSLYAKWGFVLNRRRKGYYPAADGREDALELRKDL